MFSLPWKKKAKAAEPSAAADLPSLDWLTPMMPLADGLPRPDWQTIFEYADSDPSLASADQNQLWAQVARNWLNELAANLKHDYELTESDNFIVLSAGDPRYAKTLRPYLEQCLRRLLKMGKGILADKGSGKHVVIVFADLDAYYDYISFYGPQAGTYGLSSGMYLNYGYGHFVFRNEEMFQAEAIAAHEMTHALLAHLPIPLWLNEGLAVNLESAIVAGAPDTVNKSVFEQHLEFWGEQEIQEFWRGDSFFCGDEGQALSYQLARILVANLSNNDELFVEFANKANHSDGGEKAMQDIYNLSLGSLISGFLGEGDWQPKPKSWDSLQSSESDKQSAAV